MFRSTRIGLSLPLRRIVNSCHFTDVPLREHGAHVARSVSILSDELRWQCQRKRRPGASVGVAPTFWARGLSIDSRPPSDTGAKSAEKENRQDGEEVRLSGLTGAIVEMMNRSFICFPHGTLASMTALDIISIYGMHKLLVISEVHVPAAFAVAFAMNRPLRKFRLPLDIAGAAFLCQLFPALGKVQIVRALRALAPNPIQNNASKIPPWMQNAADKMGDVVDSYGAAYFIASRWMGVAVVLSLYTGINSGLDVSSYLARFGVSEFGDVLGSWAAAVVLTSSIYPFTLVAGGALGPVVSKLVWSQFPQFIPLNKKK